jgi:hypothetical protein
LAQARVAEHAHLACDVAQIALHARGLQLGHQCLAHALDAFAHAGQLFFPHRPQFGVVSTMLTTWAPKVGGVL